MNASDVAASPEDGLVLLDYVFASVGGGDGDEESLNNTTEWNNNNKTISGVQVFDQGNNYTWAAELGVPYHWLIQHAQRHTPPVMHMAVGVILTMIGVLGTAGNAIVLWVFTR